VRVEPPPLSAPLSAATAASGGVELVEVDAAQDGQRIDNFLLGRIKGVPTAACTGHYAVVRCGSTRAG
jgi:hypothetical protein